jgi:electron transport complex protein RnfG
MSHAPAPSAMHPDAAPIDVRSWKLLVTLAIAGGLAGGGIVLVYNATLPRIEAHRAAVVEQAVREVLPGCVRWDTLYVTGGALRKQRPTGADAKTAEHVFLGFDGSGNTVGTAITAGEPGFSEMVSLIFGLDPATGTLTGMKILDEKETPGLGDKIEHAVFRDQFKGVQTPLVAVKAKTGSNGEVQAITGATISSRAVLRIINHAVERWRPLLQAYLQGGTS